MAAHYCSVFNLLDFPAATLPVTRETEEDQLGLDSYEATDPIHETIRKVGLIDFYETKICLELLYLLNFMKFCNTKLCHYK